MPLWTDPDDHTSDERDWEKAEAYVHSQAHESEDDYPFLLGAFKAQHPARFHVNPQEKTDMGNIQFVRTPARIASTARRVARNYVAKVAYEEGFKSPDGLGWENGTVEDNEFHGEGSLFPPGRDGQGGSLENYAKVPTNGLTTMLSKNKAPKTAAGMSHEDAMRVLRKENPGWHRSELEQTIGSVSNLMSPEASRIQKRYYALVK